MQERPPGALFTAMAAIAAISRDMERPVKTIPGIVSPERAKHRAERRKRKRIALASKRLNRRTGG